MALLPAAPSSGSLPDKLAQYAQTQLKQTLGPMKGVLLPVRVATVDTLVALMGIRAIACLIHSLPN